MKKSLKKTIAFLISATLLLSALPFSVSAAEAEGEAVAATEAEPVGAEETDSNVGAEEADSNVGAESDSEAVGSGNVVYFDTSTANGWGENLIKQGVFFFLRDIKEGEIITWGSKKGKMKSEGNGIYSYDLGEKDIELKSDHQYAVNFAAGDRWSVQTCDLLIGEPCFGHTASCTGKLVENNIDSNKKNNEVFWDNGVDQSKYAPPLIITSIGNVIGNVPIKPQYDMMVQFLSEMLTNAREYANKNDQQLIDDVASALGLGREDVKKAINESGASVEWSEGNSSLPGGSTSSGDGGSSSDPGSSSNSSSGSGGNGTPAANNTGTGGTRTVSSGSSTGSSTTTGGASSVTTGPETTVLFVLGGMMVAAAGVLFLSRKKREY